MLPFFLAAAFFALGLPPFVSLSFDKGWIPLMPSFLYETTWLVAFITSVIFVYLYRMAKPSLFVQFYLLSLVVKLVACLSYALLVILENRAGAVANVVYLLLVYLLYTGLEIAFLFRRISGSSPS